VEYRALRGGSGSVRVSVDGVKHHRGTSVEVKPFTLLLGPPGAGKSSFARALYLAVWLAYGRRPDKLIPAVLAPPPERFCVGMGGSRVCWRGGGVDVEGGVPWSGAVLLPCDYYSKLRMMNELGIVAATVVRGRLRSTGFGVLLGVAMKTLGEASFLGSLGLLASDLSHVYRGEHLLTPLGGLARIVNGAMKPVMERLMRGLNPSSSPTSVLAARALRSLLLDAPPLTLLVAEEPFLPLLGAPDTVFAGEAAERVRRGEVYVVATLSLSHREDAVRAAKRILEGTGLQGSAAVYVFTGGGAERVL